MTPMSAHVRPARLGQLAVWQWWVQPAEDALGRPRTITPAAAFLAGTSAGWALTRRGAERAARRRLRIHRLVAHPGRLADLGDPEEVAA